MTIICRYIFLQFWLKQHFASTICVNFAICIYRISRPSAATIRGRLDFEGGVYRDQHTRAYTPSIISLFVSMYNACAHTYIAGDPLSCSEISHTLLSVHVMATICLLPSSSILQPCPPQYAMLRNRHTLAIRWTKPGYHGDAVSGGARRLLCQCISVVHTPERVWHSEKPLLPNYW